MAAALTAMLSGGRVDVRSAGSEPADAVHPNVVRVMAELDVDLTAKRPRLIDDEAVREADAVITMGCSDACPVFPGKRYLDWQIDDPGGMSPSQSRRIRGIIRLKVEGLLHEMNLLHP